MSGAREEIPSAEADEQPSLLSGQADASAPPPVSRRQILFAVGFTLVAVVGLYFLIPKFAGLNQTWGRLKHGNAVFLIIAATLEMISVAGYAVLFRTVFSRGYPRLTWGASIQIPLAGIAAIRLLAAAGAGGVAVTVWALRRATLGPRTIACRMVALYVLQYTVYLGALVVCGFGLRWGVFSGPAPFPLTALPAFLGAAVIVLVVSAGLVPRDFERRLGQLSRRRGRVGRLAARFATAPAILGTAVRTVFGLIRERRVGLLGVFVYWGFDIAVLGSTFRAFGTTLPVAVLIMGYFLGTLGSLLPMPGGIGGVEGGMIGVFAAFGIPASHALVGVLAYSAIAFWLPALPGIAGYLGLRKRIRRWQEEDRVQAGSDGAASARLPAGGGAAVDGRREASAGDAVEASP